MKKTKKTIAALVAILFAAQSSLLVPRANAAIGLILYAAKNHRVGVPLMIAGGVGIVPGAPVAGLIAAAAYTPPATGWAVASAGLVGVGAGILVALVGLLVLDAGPQQDLTFAPVSDGEASQLGMTPAEQAGYNHELAEINALRENVRDDVLKSGHPSFTVTSAVWDSYSGMISADAYQGLKKVSAGIRRATGG